MIQDPLLQYEKKNHINTNPSSITSVVLRIFKLLSIYLLLTGTIFSILMGLLNFSAYSAMVTNWVNPDLLLNQQNDIE